MTRQLQTAQFDRCLRFLHDLLVKRGWTLDGNEPTSEDGYPYSELTGWTYRSSYGGVQMNDVENFTPSPLLCCFGIGPFDLPIGIEVATAGNYEGCPEHATVTHEFLVHLHDSDGQVDWPGLEGLLDKLEGMARDLDPRALIDCWFFGDCGRNL